MVLMVCECGTRMLSQGAVRGLVCPVCDTGTAQSAPLRHVVRRQVQMLAVAAEHEPLPEWALARASAALREVLSMVDRLAEHREDRRIA